MKKNISILFSVLGLFVFMIQTGCEGPAGPAGADANSSCLECHSEAGMMTINASYEKSGHYAAEAVGYAGGRGSCTPCHSHEQFMNYMEATPGADFVDIAYPTKIKCQTCHEDHSNLEEPIAVPLTTMEPVTGIADGMVYDFEGSSNLCAQCHQSRRGYDYYEALDSVKIDDVMTAVGDGMVAINSSHAGPHHGPQVTTLFGQGGYGTSETHAHTSVGCTGCHMGETGDDEGGHSFKPNPDNCTQCHGAIEFPNFDSRMEAIAAKLVEVGALSGDAEEGYHPTVSIVKQAEFEAFWNYMMLYEDHSRGAHNPAYFKTLLSRAEANLGI